MKKVIAISVLAALASVSMADITSVVLTDNAAADVNLTTEGTTDWVMLGYGGLGNRDEKAGAAYIGAVTISGTPATWTGTPHDFSWTDGSPTLSATAAAGNSEAKPLGTDEQSLSFSVADLAVGDYSMVVYGSLYQCTGLLTATMGASTDSAAVLAANGIFTIDFSIDTFGDSMDVSYVLVENDPVGGGDRNVSLNAMTLQAVPEPATLGLVAIFGGGLFVLRRRFKR